jgi:DNA-binding transcriptional MerR regulator
MNDDPISHDPKVPVYGTEAEGTYTIEMIAELAGMDSRTVLRYQESGYIHPVATYGWEGTPVFDDESLRSLRRIEHLRATCAVNDAGLKLILDLLREVERLRRERRVSG